MMAPATARLMPEEQEAVTKPASPPVSLAITALALRCRSLISTNCGRMAAMASTASGTTMEAPSEVMVPETLMTGRRPILLLISSVMSFSCLCDALGIDIYAIIM
ncbi:hypothetical protein D3C72_1951860 [compost metagenome]